jgi:hypothetical protein
LPFARAIAIPLAGAHPQQIDLELGEGRQNVEEHLSHRIMRVIDRAGDRKSHTAGGERIADRSGVRDRPGEPIELGHDQRVAFADRGERLLQSWPVAVSSGQAMVQVHAIVTDTELAQREALRGEVLLIGRATGIPDQHAARERMPLL